MSLQGDQWERLSNFLLSSFNVLTLATMLRFRLNKKLDDYSLAVSGTSMRQVAFDLINAAEMEGWTEDLIAAAQDFRPNNRDVARLAEELAVVGTGQQRSALESVVRRSSKFVDVDAFFETYGIRRGQVCRIEYPVPAGTEYGTGFLVGPDLIMTARHVVAQAINGNLNGDRLICRFDFKILPNGKTLGGTIYHPLAEKWLVADRPHAKSDETSSGQPKAEELDYALLRIGNKAGEDVLGRGNASGGGAVERDATRRGWIGLSAMPPAAITGANVLLLQHPAGEPMKLSIGQVTRSESEFRVRHDARSLPGSSGSPCCNEDLDVVAMHQAGDPLHSELRGDYNQGVPMAKIVDDLKAQGIEPFWEQIPPASPNLPQCD